jgi:hypothetical protein
MFSVVTAVMISPDKQLFKISSGTLGLLKAFPMQINDIKFYTVVY